MKRTLPLRIFLAQLAFTVVAAAAAVVLVRQAFERYATKWEQSVEGLPTQMSLQPLVNEVAAAFLVRLEDTVPERREAARERISEGIGSLLKAVPAIRSLVVVDTNLTIQYASDKDLVDLTYGDGEYRRFLGSEVETRRPVVAEGEDLWEVVWPIRDLQGALARGGAPRRLGAVLVRYRKDLAELKTFGTTLRPEPVPWEAMVRAMLPFLVAGVMASVLIAAWAAFPVRRLVRALEDYRARGFQGGFDAGSLGLPGDLDPAVRAISEMGGRLASLDARGREREALLGTLAESLEEGMIALDPAERPAAWNAAALRLLGVPDAGAGEEETSRAIVREVRRCLDAMPSGTGLGRGEIRLRRPDGRAAHVEVTREPFEIAPGTRGTLLFLRDLSTLRTVETHLLEAGRFATLAHLAGALAHEIRNPLNSIGLNAAALKENVDAGSPPSRTVSMRDSIVTIEDETRRLTDLLNNYLGLLRPSPLEGPVDVRDLCRRVVQLLRFSAIKSGVNLSLEGDPVPDVHGVPDHLQQAVLNLALNAVQATPRGGRVTLATVAAEGEVRLSVSDTGPGLPPDVAEHVFESHASTRSGGTGLGLPLVRMIVEAHGGTVGYTTSSGRGTSFTISLPEAPSRGA